jgi:hypothetical protein
MMQLPVTDKELDTIILTLKSVHPTLYAKLWTYKINKLKESKKDGFS